MKMRLIMGVRLSEPQSGSVVGSKGSLRECDRFRIPCSIRMIRRLSCEEHLSW